jgi:hypothetical protein
MVLYSLSPTDVRLEWDAVAPEFQDLERVATNSLVVRIA